MRTYKSLKADALKRAASFERYASMKRFQKTIGVILALLLIVFAGFLLFRIVSWISGLEASSLGAVVAAATALAGVLYTQWQAKSREIAEGHREKKIELYNLFFDIIDRFLNDAKESVETLEEGQIPDDLKKQFAALNRGLIIWASPKVIGAWLKFRKHSGSDDTIFYVDDILQAIRKDLGNSNFGMKRGDAIKVLLSDPGEVDTKLKNSS